MACVSHQKSVFHKGYQSRGMVDCVRNTQYHSKWVCDHTCISGLGSNVFGVFLLQGGSGEGLALELTLDGILDLFDGESSFLALSCAPESLVAFILVKDRSCQ